MKKSYYSHGKLLLTAEYAVLDGGLALAIPTRYGQELSVQPSDNEGLVWESLDTSGTPWFQCHLELENKVTISSTSDPAIATRLAEIINEIQNLNPTFLKNISGHTITTLLEFPRNWGLGTSSTLINNLADLAAVDPYTLLANTFGGSGYDIACAQHSSPILYQLKDGKPWVKEVSFDPIFKEQLYFVFLNQKQDSRDAIASYRRQDPNENSLSSQLSEITIQLLETKDLEKFETLLETHESLLASILKVPPIKEKSFPDYFGKLKSLGGWGGDFILATGNEKTPDYFKAKGFSVCIPYVEMVL